MGEPEQKKIEMAKKKNERENLSREHATEFNQDLS